MINLDLASIYDVESVTFNREKSVLEFRSPQRENTPPVLMAVEIKPHPDELLTNVYNLAMGPKNDIGQIDDKVRLKHVDSSKMFSTVIVFAIAFLDEFSDLIIGLDGSDDLRATLYHSMFQSNREQLNDFITCIGVDWYVKLLRNRQEIERTSDGSPFFKPRPEPFDFTRTRHDLYRYYMIQRKPEQ